MHARRNSYKYHQNAEKVITTTVLDETTRCQSLYLKIHFQIYRNRGNPSKENTLFFRKNVKKCVKESILRL